MHTTSKKHPYKPYNKNTTLFFNKLKAIFDEKLLFKKLSMIQSKFIKTENFNDNKWPAELTRLLNKNKNVDNYAKISIKNFSKVEIPDDIEITLSHPFDGIARKNRILSQFGPPTIK